MKRAGRSYGCVYYLTLVFAQMIAVELKFNAVLPTTVVRSM